MGKKSRTKGTIYELEIARILKKFGFGKARRTAQHCGKSGDASDVVGLPGIHIECKHYKNTGFKYEWLNQAIRDSKSSEIPVVCHRTDRNPNVVTLRLEDFISLYKKANFDSEEDDDSRDEIERVHEYRSSINTTKAYIKNVFKRLSDSEDIYTLLERAGMDTENEIASKRNSKKIIEFPEYEEDEELER